MTPKTPKPDLLKTYKLKKTLPQHIAIIMDGNGRWAKKRILQRSDGHKAGYKALRNTLESCVDFGVSYLSVYAFSTENWKRPKTEVSFLMDMFSKLIIDTIPDLNDIGARLRVMGNISQLDTDIQHNIEKAESETKANTTIQLNLMFNYGGRDEILHAIKAITTSPDYDPNSLTEDTISQHLYTAGIPDPELMIRTGGDNIRISNYLLWQMAYTDFFFIDTLWPDFDEATLGQILHQFQHRDRKFGGLIG